MRLLRSKATSLDAYFGEVGVTAKLPNTQATVHCRFLKHDGMNKPRVRGLADRLAQEVINYAIPRSAIAAARRDANGPNDARHFAALYRKANRLFTDLRNSGEGGELLLYLMTESYLKIPQLFCKMPLKTSSQMHYHGTDGVHGIYDPIADSLALYWGESKLYSSVTAAIDECIKSLAPFLQSDGGSSAPQERDLELLSDHLDLDDPLLEKALLRYLDPDDPNYNKMIYRGIALVGFDSDKYASGKLPITETDLHKELAGSAETWQKSVSYHVTKHKLDEITIEIFCVPFPSVETFRAAFLEELGL
jgi:hypothetical protein